MDNPETLGRVSDSILQEPVKITVDVRATSVMEKWLMKWGIKPSKRVFAIYPIVFGNLIRISKLVRSINMNLQATNLLDASFEAMSEHGDAMARIIAMAIQQQKQEPSEKMVRFILGNFTAQEMKTVLSVVLRQMDVQSFMMSIISMKGLNVLDKKENGKAEVSPAEKGS